MDNLYQSLEERYGLPAGTLSAVQDTESGGNDMAISPKGAKGRFQFMPETAKAYGVDVNDPVSSAHGAAQYLSDLVKQYGSVQAALAHYNGGTKAGEAVSQGAEPPATETKNYLTKVNSKLTVPQDLEFTPLSADVRTDEIPSDLEFIPITETTATKEPNKFEKMSFGKQSLEGLKKSFRDLSLGAKQLVDMPVKEIAKKYPEATAALDKFGAQFGLPNAKESIEKTPKEILKEREEYAPLMKTAGGITGHIGGDIGTSLAGGLALKGLGAIGAGEALLNPTTYKAAAGLGAAQGALQPTLPEENKAFNTAAGATMGMLGLGAVNTLGRVAQPVKDTLGKIGQESINILKKAGVPLDAAQTTGSALLERVKASLNDNPLTAGAQNLFTSTQNKAFTKAIAKTMGEDTTEITPEVISQAKERIGNVYDSIANKINIKANDKFLNNLSLLDEEAKNVLNDSQYGIIDKNIKNIIDKASKEGNQISGQQYQTIKRTLDKLSGSSDSDVASYARDLKDVLHKGLSDSAEASGNKELVAQLKEANKQYGNMRKIEDIALKNPEGEISPSLLYNSLTTKAKRNAFYAEDPELAKLAAAGKTILPNRLPNSGTVARLTAQYAPAAITGAAYGLYKGDLGSAAEGAALGYALPKALQQIINNPAAAMYLEQGLKPGALRTMLELPKRVQAQRIPISEFNAYLQSVPQARKQ
jgi:Transglycosylase SLT domain